MARTLPKHRFLAENLTGTSATLIGAEAHHALHVLRLGVGDAVVLFDGRGRSATGAITECMRDAVVVAIEPINGPHPRPTPRIRLSFAPPKGKRLDWLLEKAAELGVMAIRPIICERSVAKVRFKQELQARWRGICSSAIRQSGQSHLPDIVPPAKFADAVAGGPDGVGLIAHGGPNVPAIGSVLAGRCVEEVDLLVGPEGGWTDSELQAAREAGFESVRLGWTVLRVETAAAALPAAIVALCQGGS